MLPLQGINLDLAEIYLSPQQARFIKNLTYEPIDTSEDGIGKGAQTGLFKTIESTELYADIPLPEGINLTIGAPAFKETNEVFVFIWNSLNNHSVYRLNGKDGTYDIVYTGSCLKFIFEPQYFVHDGGVTLYIAYIVNPETGEKKRRSTLFFTRGIDRQMQIVVEDSIATQGFDPNIFSYFQGGYDKCELISMGLATPHDCITVEEIPNIGTSEQKNNNLLFNTWQFRITYIDVWGRPSEHGIISDIYIPGVNDCIATSNNIARCLNLTFKAPIPIVDKIQIEYRNCNDQQWYLDNALDLYSGSPLGEWWLRVRNPNINYSIADETITYQFCRDKECDIIPVTETNRLGNPIPRESESVTQIGKFIALADNKDGFNPFSQTLKDNIEVIVEPPETGTGKPAANIEVWVAIYNPKIDQQQNIWKYDDTYGYAFGGANYRVVSNVIVDRRVAPNYKQYFKVPTQKGFIGYLVGEATAISEQYYVDNSNLEPVLDTEFASNNYLDGRRYFQKFTFSNVSKGKHVFRICSHQADPQSANPEKTSTYLYGTNPFNSATKRVDYTHTIDYSKELIIDVCEGDYDTMKSNEILIIFDLTRPGERSTQAMAGYVYESFKEPVIPMELLQVFAGGSANSSSRFTDHNGFYFAASESNGWDVNFGGYYKCEKKIFTGGGVGSLPQLYEQNFALDEVNHGVYDDYELVDCNRVLVEGIVKLCDTEIGVPNVTVVLSRGQSALTDADGKFTIIAHDDGTGTVRDDKLYLIGGSCAYTGCNNECIEVKDIRIMPCITCEERIQTVSDWFLFAEIRRGRLSGGTYVDGVTGWDWLGRPTFVQVLATSTMPSVISTKTFVPSKVRVNILAGAVFPPETAYITFWTTPETTLSDYLTWIVDKAEFIDNTGNVNTINPTQIKIYYGSLIEYNKQNNYNTTTIWDFIAESTSKPVVSDKVQFLLNGDGNFFTKNITSLVKYNQTGEYFLIDYTADLKDLKQDALIRLMRPKVCTGNEGFYENCYSVDIVNRHAVQTDFYLPFFDTYYNSRSIPVPVTTTIPPTGNETESTTVTVNVLRTFGFPFEHHSPSDFWGLRCWNIGRVSSKNPYETELFHLHQIALSGAMSITGQLNFLNYFDDANKQNVEVPTNYGGIVSLFPTIGKVVGICQTNLFIIGFNDNLARAIADGSVQVQSIDDKFGKPLTKDGQDYGCLLFDKNTIRSLNGLIQFLDCTKCVLIQHNFQQAIECSTGIVDSYIRPKIKYIQQYNLTHANKKYFVGGINAINYEYRLTDFTITGGYLNQLREIDIKVSDTIIFDIRIFQGKRIWKGFESATPEYYASLEGELNEQQLFTFKNGLPYKHYTVSENVTYGTIYGEKVNRVVDIVMSTDGLKKKKYLSTSVYCKQGVYFCDKITTETGQLSRILKEYFNQAEYFFSAPFLCDLNTPPDPNLKKETGANVLLDGNNLYGTWIRVRYIGDPDKDTEYTELAGFTIDVFPSEKSGT